MPNLITREEQLDSAVSSIRLMLWFAREWLKTHPKESLQNVIRKRTDIWRRTTFSPEYMDGRMEGFSHAWLDMLDRLEGVYKETRTHADSEGFENACLPLLFPFIEGRVDRDVKDHLHSTQIAAYQCGSLRYNLLPEASNPRRIDFHIANARYPGSPFDDKFYLPACLLVLCSQCEAKFEVTEIGTGTWMNSLPKWLKLFPAEWQENLTAPEDDILGHYGFWGQFITARRTFNHALGTQFRQTGSMPYPPRYSWCPIAALRTHLQTTFQTMCAIKTGRNARLRQC